MEIPTDIWSRVLSTLSPAELVRVGQAAPRLREVCKGLRVWTNVRETLRLPKARPKAWKKVNDYVIATSAACYRCRQRRRLLGQPLCRRCMDSHPMLGPLRHRLHRVEMALSSRYSQRHYYMMYNIYLTPGFWSIWEADVTALNTELCTKRALFQAELQSART